jgi:hypothetical protein
MSARNPMPGLPGLFLDSLSPHLPYLMMGINIAVRADKYCRESRPIAAFLRSGLP